VQSSIRYRKERQYAGERTVALVVLMSASFLLSVWMKDLIVSGFVLLGAWFASGVYLYVIARYPDRFVTVRKVLLLGMDIAVVSFIVTIFGNNGLYALPFYLVVILRSGLAFGTNYFNLGIFFSAITWFLLFLYMSFWHEHSEILMMFALTTAIVAVFFQRIILRLDEENRLLNRTLTEVSRSAAFDELTGVANRKEYKNAIRAFIRKKEPFSLLFIDLNKFKAINDTYGHHIGDEVLKEVARRLRETIDESDFLARLGGDEFAMITERKPAYMRKFVRSIETNVIGEHRIGSIVVRIELSIGISCYPTDASTAMLLGKYADEAMYAAKKDHARYHYFYAELNESQKEGL